MNRTSSMVGTLLTVVFLLPVFAPVEQASAQTCALPPTGLISWWPGDGDANDIVGGNDGTPVNGATTAPGKVGSAFSFNGVDDFVQVPDSDFWTFTGDFTIDAWVKIETESTVGPAFVSHDEGPGNINKWIFGRFGPNSGAPVAKRGRTGFLINEPPSGLAWLAGDPWTPDPNKFHHLAVVRSGDTFTFYRDGEFDGTDLTTLPIPNAAASLEIGKAEVGFRLDGLIDEVEIYNRALSEQEIQDIFNAGSAGKCKTVVILGAEVDLKTNTLLISGVNFGSTGVFLGVVKLFVPTQGDVILDVLNFDPLAQEILTDLPVEVVDTPGTFRLVVINGSEADDFSVTIVRGAKTKK